MTEPLKPVNYINIGGVRFNSNDVEQQQTILKNGAVRYSVFLKNGVHLEFPKQKAENNASVEDRADNVTDKETWTNINHLAYGEIKGTEKSDVISLWSNNGTTVDVSGGNGKFKMDHIMIHDGYRNGKNGEFVYNNKGQAIFEKSQNNKVITDENDYVDIETSDTRATIKGEGITSENSFKGVKQD